MIYKCAGIEITPEALLRVSQAAREWAQDPALDSDEQAMARQLERQASQLAAATTMTGKDVALVKKLCCRLFAIMNDGAKPGPGNWPCGPRGDVARGAGLTA